MGWDGVYADLAVTLCGLTFKDTAVVDRASCVANQAKLL